MSRYTGPARITFSGDERIAKAYLSEGRKYLGTLFAVNNVPHLSRRLVNADGVAFEVQVVAGQPQLHIDARKYAKNNRQFATILYYFDSDADLLRGIDVDTGVQVAAVSGFTAMSVMALHPNNKWLFCTASVGAANYDNVFINLSLLSANAFASPVISTAIRPNNRVALPVARRISADGARLLTSYARTADPVTNIVIEGFGVFCAFDITEQPSGLPLYSLATVIERGLNPVYPLPMAFINNTDTLLYVSLDTDAAATPVEPGPTETVYSRMRRVSVTGVNNGVVNYGSGEYQPGFHPGIYARDVQVKGAYAYVVFINNSANIADIPPYSISTNRDVEILDISTNAVSVGGVNVVPTIGYSGASIVAAVVLRYGSTLVTIQSDNAVQRTDISDPTAPVLAASGTVNHVAGNVTAAYCDVGPKLDSAESEDNRIFVSYDLSAGGYVMLIFRPEKLSGMENGGTITPYKSISMPGFSGNPESVVIKREQRY